MRVKVSRKSENVVLEVTVDLEVEVAFKDRVELEVLRGKYSYDKESLEGGKSFAKLELVSKPISDSETAEKAVEELMKLKSELERMVVMKTRKINTKINALAGFFAEALKEEGIETEVD